MSPHQKHFVSKGQLTRQLMLMYSTLSKFTLLMRNHDYLTQIEQYIIHYNKLVKYKRKLICQMVQNVLLNNRNGITEKICYTYKLTTSTSDDETSNRNTHTTGIKSAL